MTLKDTIELKLAEAFRPLHLEVVNESGNHNVPAGSETHFKVVVVAAEFGDQRLIARHRAVNAVLASELQGGVHALAIHTYAPDEWHGEAPDSPRCLGGSKAEA